MLFVYKIFSCIYRVLKYCNRKSKLKDALGKGLIMGGGTRLVGDVEFGTEPFLIELGESCLVTDGVKFITHNGGVQVSYIKNGACFDEIYAKKILVGKIKVGDNVFIGSNTLILYDTLVGDNVIIGAGSVVKGDFPSDVVISGVPARIICSIDDYRSKISNKVLAISDNEERSVQIKNHVNKINRAS